LPRRRLVLLVLAAALLLIPAAPARADDAAVKRAWDAHDAQFAKLGGDYRAALKRWRSSGFKRAKGALGANRKARALLARNTRGVTAASPSSADGERARRLALASNAAFSNQLLYQARGIRLTTAGRRSAGNREFARGVTAARRSARAAKKAKTLLRRAGVG